MKIQAINTNTNFKGLFTNKSKENGGNWKMEYQPYSWERNSNQEIGKMAIKEKLNIFSSKLPDNEEIFAVNTPSAKESSKDILGTESYYLGYNGSMRRTIDEKPAMNREDSLKVLHKKYGKFLDMKKDAARVLENKFPEYKETAGNLSWNYDSASMAQSRGYEYGQGFMCKSDGLNMMNTAKYNMDSSKQALEDNFSSFYNKVQEYTKLTNSIIGAGENREKISEEINKIKELRESGKLIDISKLNISKTDAPLAAALQNMNEAAKKFICMPHKIISFEEVLHNVQAQNLPGELSNRILGYVKNLIKHGI